VLVFIVRRLLWAVLLMFVVTLIVFVMFFVLPADSRNAQRNEQGFAPGLQTQFNIRGSFGEEYARFMTHVLRGDLGDSTRQNNAVTDVIRKTLPVTVSLVLGGYCDLHYQAESTSLCGGPRYWAYHMILPWLTFASLFAALYARMIRASLLEALDEDYVRTARAKAAGGFRVLRKHVFRNALMPVITMLGMDVGVAFAGALFIETVFTLPGMGWLLVRSLANSDLPMILGIVIVVCIAVVIANLIVDLLYGALDPRVRMRTKGDATVVSRAVGRELARAATGARQRVGYDAVSHCAQACS
jgi:ABC-type dipeptide/oligopeptide/nickel transport system permease component